MNETPRAERPRRRLVPLPELFQMRDELNSLRKQNQRLQASLDSRDEVIERLRSRLSFLEQSADSSWPKEFIPHLYCFRNTVDELIHFRPAEWKILSMLLHRRGQTVSRDELYDHLYMERAVDRDLPDVRIIHVYISRLRAKFKHSHWRIASAIAGGKPSGTYTLLTLEEYDEWKSRHQHVTWGLWQHVAGS